MSYSSFKPLALAAALVSSSCASTPSTPGTPMNPTDELPAYMQPVKEWPLRFKAHSFSVMTYDTWGAEVVYAGRLRTQDDDDVLQRSSASYGPDWQRGWGGTYGDILNFPPPAQLKWRSKDGTPLEAEIDIGAIFSDEVIRHEVSREEMAYLPDGKYESEPAIILEINDRTVHVYMQSTIPLRRRIEIQGVMRNDHRAEPVLVKTYTY
jgi:hypothetical protein